MPNVKNMKQKRYSANFPVLIPSRRGIESPFWVNSRIDHIGKDPIPPEAYDPDYNTNIILPPREGKTLIFVEDYWEDNRLLFLTPAHKVGEALITKLLGKGRTDRPILPVKSRANWCINDDIQPIIRKAEEMGCLTASLCLLKDRDGNPYCPFYKPPKEIESFADDFCWSEIDLSDRKKTNLDKIFRKYCKDKEVCFYYLQRHLIKKGDPHVVACFQRMGEYPKNFNEEIKRIEIPFISPELCMIDEAEMLVPMAYSEANRFIIFYSKDLVPMAGDARNELKYIENQLDRLKEKALQDKRQSNTFKIMENIFPFIKRLFEGTEIFLKKQLVRLKVEAINKNSSAGELRSLSGDYDLDGNWVEVETPGEELVKALEDLPEELASDHIMIGVKKIEYLLVIECLIDELFGKSRENAYQLAASAIRIFYSDLVIERLESSISRGHTKTKMTNHLEVLLKQRPYLRPGKSIALKFLGIMEAMQKSSTPTLELIRFQTATTRGFKLSAPILKRENGRELIDLSGPLDGVYRRLYPDRYPGIPNNKKGGLKLLGATNRSTTPKALGFADGVEWEIVIGDSRLPLTDLKSYFSNKTFSASRASSITNLNQILDLARQLSMKKGPFFFYLARKHEYEGLRSTAERLSKRGRVPSYESPSPNIPLYMNYLVWMPEFTRGKDEREINREIRDNPKNLIYFDYQRDATSRGHQFEGIKGVFMVSLSQTNKNLARPLFKRIWDREFGDMDKPPITVEDMINLDAIQTTVQSQMRFSYHIDSEKSYIGSTYFLLDNTYFQMVAKYKDKLREFGQGWIADVVLNAEERNMFKNGNGKREFNKKFFNGLFGKLEPSPKFLDGIKDRMPERGITIKELSERIWKKDSQTMRDITKRLLLLDQKENRWHREGGKYFKEEGID